MAPSATTAPTTATRTTATRATKAAEKKKEKKELSKKLEAESRQFFTIQVQMSLPRIIFGDSKKETVALELSDEMVFVEKYKGHPAAVYMPKKHFLEIQADLTYVSPLPKPTISEENHKQIDEIVSGKFQAIGKKVQTAFSALDAFRPPKIHSLTLRKTAKLETPPSVSPDTPTSKSEKVGFEVEPLGAVKENHVGLSESS